MISLRKAFTVFAGVGVLVIAGVGLCTVCRPAAARQAFLSQEAAGSDWRVQGEYIGGAGRNRMAAQVFALGDGKFDVYILNGGLPGAGWDQKEKMMASAESSSPNAAAISGGGWTGVIRQGTLTAKSPTGQIVRMRHMERKSKTLGMRPPAGALILFDGRSADAWRDGHILEGDLLNCGTLSKRSFGDCQLHLEFRLPFVPKARGQGRGNSGVYLQNRYEFQVLDTFALKGDKYECGAVYSQAAPILNMCLPPLEWQTYDFDFRAARFDAAGKKTEDAIVTLLHNGVVIHDKLHLTGPTPAGDAESAAPGPIQLQAHGNPVVFRNIWIVAK